MNIVKKDDLVIVDQSVRGVALLGKVAETVTMDSGDVIVIVEVGGELIKVRDRNVEVVKTADDKPVPNDSITISREEFHKVVFDVVEKEAKHKNDDAHLFLLMSLIGLLIGRRLEEALFGECDND